MIGIDSMSQQVRKDRNKENPSYSWPVTKFVATPIYSIYFQHNSLIMLLFLYYIIKYNDYLIIFDCLLVGMHVCPLMPVEVRTNFWNTVLSFHLLNSKDWIQVVRLGHKAPYPPSHSFVLIVLGADSDILCLHKWILWTDKRATDLGKRLTVHTGKEAHRAC